VGSVLFFSFAVAPIVFAVLGPENGGKFVRALFPRYYAWGAIAGAIALPAFVAVPLCYPEYRGAAVGVQSLIILACTLIMLYAGNSLTPAINAARDAGPEGHERFERLHRRSVRLNALVLVIGLGLLIAFANRPTPRTSGITELSPGERTRFDSELNQVIEQVEAKYGFRPGRPGQVGTTVSPGLAVDAEMVKEIESYYEQKRLRDLSRKRRSPAPPGRPEPERPRPLEGAPTAAPESGKQQSK
jgi:uncharacterized protein DUF4149